MFASSLCILGTGGQQWFLEPKIAGSDPATPSSRNRASKCSKRPEIGRLVSKSGYREYRDSEIHESMTYLDITGHYTLSFFYHSRGSFLK